MEEDLSDLQERKCQLSAECVGWEEGESGSERDRCSEQEQGDWRGEGLNGVCKPYGIQSQLIQKRNKWEWLDSQVEPCGAAKRVRVTLSAEDELSRAVKWVLDATRPNCFCKDATSALPVPVLR